MPESHLWLVNHLGCSFTLGTFHRKFQQLDNTWDDAVSIKRLSASHWCAWAIGHDHRVYIYVRSSDVPIRVPETTFENQRWSFHGYSKSGLIKTDRPAWSNETGKTYRPKESVRLPSAHWEWEGDWLIDDNLRGEVVGIEGWQYAVDFPAIYTPEKHWNSFVRKRKWIRFRRFSSTDIWARISDMEVVERAECFIDVSVGGFLMPSQPAGFLSVWAVTNNGHVYVRAGVNHDNPEGSTWQEIGIADHLGIINISVGASNLVWAVAWDGNMLVRTHITRNKVYGSGWAVVEHPDNSTRFMQVSVGKNSVWAISREGKVWFRKGTSGDDMFWNLESAVGTSWVEMVGEMSHVTVSSNDQVFAIDLAGKNICFRTGISTADRTGKTWQQVSLHEDLTTLLKEGFLSEGEVCSCGDPDLPCGLHLESRPRLSSTTTSCSSISGATNVEESNDGFTSPLQPYQPFPIHISEQFSASLPWKHSRLMSSDCDIVNVCLEQSPTEDTPAALAGSNSPSCLPSDCCSTVQKEEEKPQEITTKQQTSFSITLSTSQTSLPLQAENIAFYQPATTAAVVPFTAMVASHTLTKNMHTTVLPNGDESIKLKQKIPCTDANRLDNNYTKDRPPTEVNHLTENSQTTLKDTSLGNCFCETAQKIDSHNYVLAPSNSQRRIDDREVQETLFLVPFSEVAVASVSLVRSARDIMLTQINHFDHYHPGSNNILGSTDQSWKSHKGKTQISVSSINNNELDVVQADGRLHTPATSVDAFITDSSPSVSQLAGVSAESPMQSKMTNELNNAASRLSLEENDSSACVSNISVCDIEQPTSRHASNQKHNKGQAVYIKQPKERRPKIIDISYNEPNNESIIFKTYKTRRKRREKLVSIEDEDSEKIDTVSIGSDISHSLTYATESQIMQESISTSAESLEKDIDIDSVDRPVYHSHDPHYQVSFYQSLSTDASGFQPVFPSLNSFSGDYLTAVGFSTDSALTMLPDFESVQTQLNLPHEPKKGIPGANIRNSPKSSGIDSSVPVFVTSDRKSPKSFPVVSDIDITVLNIPMIDKGSSQPVTEQCNVHYLAREGETQSVHNLATEDTNCDQTFENSLKQDVVSIDAPLDTFINCDTNNRTHPNHDLIIPGTNYDGNVPHTNDITEKIPVKENEHYTEVIISSAEVKEHDLIANHVDIDSSLETDIPDPTSDIVEKLENVKNSHSDSKTQLKIEEFTDNKFPSFDSTSASEEILDFVTDLLMSDDEVLDKKSHFNEGETQCGSKCSPAEEISQSEHVLESLSFQKSQLHSSVSVISTQSVPRSLLNVTIEEGVQNESENTVQVTAQLSHSFSQADVAASHPKSLPFNNKKVPRYYKSLSPSCVPTGDVIPLMALTMAQPRLSWKWLDATSCVIDDPFTVEWLSNTYKESEAKKKVVKIVKQLREDVLRKLQDRNRREVHTFKDLEQAVKRSTWVKKACMQMYLYGRKGRWTVCKVELEQGISNLSEGCLTVHYQHKGKQKNTQISLSEIICVKTCSDPDTTSGFVVYTPGTNVIHQPLLVKASSENEAADWIGCLFAANAVVWNMNCSVTPGAIWSCTFTGDVFVSPATSTAKHASDLSWGQHGGHMQLVEAGPSGVTWALGFDKMPYVYNGGYGGAINTGTSEMSDNTQQIVDHHKVFVYENQKWFPVIGWCCKGVFHRDFNWLTESGRSVETKEEVKLPSSKYQWISEWTVDFSTPRGVDTNGWQYSSSLIGPFYSRQHLRSTYRRRRWFRQYRITVFGPWQAAGSLGLVDLSVQIDPVASTSDPVVLWAVGANGDVLCRNGVTSSNPKGHSWIHVATDLDKPFKSISLGGSYRVWGIAGDGSAWFRPGVSPYSQAGTCWLQVVPPPPGNFLLHQVSAGATSVWAVDTGDNLWRRENITPTFPEGTGWEFVNNRVKRVCVGPRDQVWIIADAAFSKMKHGAGVIYRRVGITSTRPTGTAWEVVIGSGWAYVSMRGVSEIKQEGYELSGLDDDRSN